MDLENKTVIITGASAGVGAACALAFAQRGANLVLVARGEARLQSFIKQLPTSTKVLAVAMDVGNLEECDQLISRTLDTFGTLHILVNNAGMHVRGNFDRIAETDVAAMIDINLKAPLYLTALALPHIMQAGSGAILMVGSLAGRTPLQGAATYAASKAGLRAFAHSLADELRGSNIVSGIVSPGPVSTEFILNNIDDVEDIVFSQPMSSARRVAEALVSIADGKGPEIALPWFSGKLTTFSYLFPSLRHSLRALLHKIGRKNKEKYRSKNVAQK